MYKVLRLLSQDMGDTGIVFYRDNVLSEMPRNQSSAPSKQGREVLPTDTCLEVIWCGSEM